MSLLLDCFHHYCRLAFVTSCENARSREITEHMTALARRLGVEPITFTEDFHWRAALMSGYVQFNNEFDIPELASVFEYCLAHTDLSN